MLDQLCYAGYGMIEQLNFPSWMTHYKELERRGLIHIYRPINSQTGEYQNEYEWNYYVTEKGMKTILDNPDIMY